MTNTIELEKQYCANNYNPLPVVFTKGEGVYVWDENGNKYIDMMCAYSAVSHGHCHPRLVRALTEQANKLAVISRAFYSDKLGQFLQKICQLTGYDKGLPMNSGAEAVETAIKAARKWGYTKKGVAENKAEIIACTGNFHGRTISIVGMSSEAQYRNGFGPFPAGSKLVTYGDAQALEAAITPNTVAFLFEPIQGEGGIIMPPSGYLKQCETICKRHGILMLADEIQTGFGRTGKLLACDHEAVKPDGLILGKALGGGLLPVSIFLANNEVMSVFTPGDHGSTFGGNTLAAAVATEAINVLLDEKLIERSAELGRYMLEQIKKIQSPLIKDIRGKGLFIGLEIDPKKAKARDVCLKLLDEGILSKDTHATVIRFAPPLVITQEQIDFAVDRIAHVLTKMSSQ